MRVAVALLAVLAVAAVVAAEDVDEKDVVVLTGDNFAQTREGKWLLEFYAPWCGHCKRLKPTYAEVATELKGKVNVGKVDCTEQREVCSRYGVRAFPTLKFQDGVKVYDYKGARGKDELITFASGEYTKSESSAAIPGDPTVVTQVLASLTQGVEALEMMMRQSTVFSVSIAFLVGTILGFFFHAAITPPPPRQAPRKSARSKKED